MTNTLNLHHDLIQTSEALDRFLVRMDDLFDSFQQTPLVCEALEQWEKLIVQSRIVLRRFPVELSKREIVQSLNLDLERYEEGCRSALKKMREIRANGSENWTSLKRQIRQEAQNLSLRIAALQNHPLVLKFMEGKKILSARANLQWSRKLFHMMNGLLGLWIYNFSGLSERGTALLLASYLAIAVLTEIFRRRYPAFNDWVCKAIGGMMRERERSQISSATWYMFSVLIVLLVFPKPVAVLTILFVAVGDTFAGIVGSLWGKHRITPHLSWEGCLACFTACFLSTLFFTPFWLPGFALAGWALLSFSLLAGLIGTFAESVFKKLDDNLVIPLVSAPLLWLLMKFF